MINEWNVGWKSSGETGRVMLQDTRRIKEKIWYQEFSLNNTGRHQLPPCKKRWLISIDFTLLNSYVVTKMLHHPPLLREGSFS